MESCLKFFTFSNYRIDPGFLAPHHRRYRGLLKWQLETVSPLSLVLPTTTDTTTTDTTTTPVVECEELVRSSGRSVMMIEEKIKIEKIGVFTRRNPHHHHHQQPPPPPPPQTQHQPPQLEHEDLNSPEKKEYLIDENFLVHNWSLIQMAKEYTLKNCFPLRIILNYVIDQHSSAQIISYEIWIDQEKFIYYMKTRGTFPYEGYFTYLLRCMLADCGGTDNFNLVKKINDSEYQFLLDTTPSLPHWNQKFPLFRHQLESFNWMTRLEQQIIENMAEIKVNQVCSPILKTGYYYYNQYDLMIPTKMTDLMSVPIRGGILADITGSGKTAIVLALILSSMNDSLAGIPQGQSPVEIIEEQIYFKSRATLVVVPNNLSQQWIQEIHKFTDVKNLKIITILDARQYKKISLQALLQADIVMITDTFLFSKRYHLEMSNQVKKIMKTSFQHPIESPAPSGPLEHAIEDKNDDLEFKNDPPLHEDDEATKLLAWRIASNCQHPGFEQDYYIPLESIKWKRIVIDEIHMFFTHHKQNDKNLVFQNLTNLRSKVYWGLTGTPMTQKSEIMQQYVYFLCKYWIHFPRYWVPDFLQNLMDQCFHRFEDLDLPPMEKHLYLIEHSEREKQLLKCCQDDLGPEKMIQLCSYFNLSEVKDINQKIQLSTIENIIYKVKKEKNKKIKDLDSKIKYHELAIQSLKSKIEESNQEIQRLGREDQIVKDENALEATQEEKHKDYDFEVYDITNMEQLIFHDLKDARDTIKGRKRRLERLMRRKDQLKYEQLSVMKSISYFETQATHFKKNNTELKESSDTTVSSPTVSPVLSSVSSSSASVSSSSVNSAQQCPICFIQPANVITQCGHLFCRGCLIRCLKQKHQCPICKIKVHPSDAHEIKLDLSRKWIDKHKYQEKILRYGSKFTKLLELIAKITESREKIVLYIQWPALMNSVYTLLKENHIDACMIHGNTSCQNMAIRKFKTSDTNVLLGSIDNTGLDLVDANHLIFVHALTGEDYMVKAIEDQAMARIQRTGQKRGVHIYWLITRGTIEEQIYLQTRV